MQDMFNHNLGIYVRAAFHAKNYPKEPFSAKHAQTNTRRFTSSNDLDKYIDAHIS